MVEMPRKNRRKHGCTPRVGLSARVTWSDGRRSTPLSPEEAFTALELDFFRRGDESALAVDCSPERTIWTEMAS
jgi:hypothetical protein